MFKTAVAFAVLAVSSIAVTGQGHHQHQYNEASADGGPVWTAPRMMAVTETMDLIGPVMFPSDVIIGSPDAAMRGDTSERAPTGEYGSISSTTGSPAAAESYTASTARAAATAAASAEILDEDLDARFAAAVMSDESLGLISKLLVPLKKTVSLIRTLNASTLVKAVLAAGLVAVLSGIAFSVAAAGVASVGGLVSAVTGLCGVVPYVEATKGGSAYLIDVIRGRLNNHAQY